MLAFSSQDPSLLGLAKSAGNSLLVSLLRSTRGKVLGLAGEIRPSFWSQWALPHPTSVSASAPWTPSSLAPLPRNMHQDPLGLKARPPRARPREEKAPFYLASFL